MDATELWDYLRDRTHNNIDNSWKLVTLGCRLEGANDTYYHVSIAALPFYNKLVYGVLS